MFEKVLVANRGEIAIRVIRACRDMGIKTVAVYSEADHRSLHVALADEAYLVGPAPSSMSYLKIENIIKALKESGAQAVHPGYGFLSENAEFAQAVKDAGAVFIGPTPENIRAMGNKLSAIEHMKKANVPTVPGSDGPVESLEHAKKVVERIGFPVIIKAAAGGGGKGMRVVHEASELEAAYRAARSEGQSYFNDSTVYIEKYITSPKHIEIQIFGDSHGNVVHLFERECSIQRRHQKLIEESPSPSVPDVVRRKMGEVAVRAAKSIGYQGAGTFEFIFDNNTKEFYFMEMNTRLQVEHPVTEQVVGCDLVMEQINVALGKPLSFKQEDLHQSGHAIEVRICAEDPANFLPSPGVIRKCRHPQGPFIRIDSYIYPGYEVPIYYDPMICKVIAWGRTRELAIQRMQRALTEFTLTGIRTNIVLHKSILEHPKFRDGSYTTQFCENDLVVTEPALFRFVDDHVFLISAALQAFQDQKKKDLAEIQPESQWKKFARMECLR
jgi:acetyl-CoA carboxylase biotin carboxylase subunit